MLFAATETIESLNPGMWIQLVTFAVIVAAAAVWLKSALVKQRHQELEELANTRGERVEDLEARLAELKIEVEQLKGQMNAIQALKATEIATEVVTQLSPILSTLKAQ